MKTLRNPLSCFRLAALSTVVWGLGCAGLLTPAPPDELTMSVLSMRKMPDGDCLWLLAVIEPWRGEGEAVRVALPEGQPTDPGWLLDGGTPVPAVAVSVPATVRSAGAEQVFTTESGREVRTGGMPPFGEPEVVIVYRLDGKRWSEVGAWATRVGPGAPGRDVGAVRELLGTRWNTLQTRCNTEPCPPPPAADGIARELGVERVGYLTAKDDIGWVFPVLTGDTEHAVGPVFQSSEHGHGQREKLRGVEEDEQVSLHVHGTWLLVSEEWTGANPRVYAPGRARPMAEWPEATHSAWLPEEL